ncbi:MAG: M1 family metallopeptidase [Crocinitomicaceae bacterium]
MKNILLILTLIIANSGFGQSYFQQDVDYKIDVTLNDRNNTLSANVEFTYKNNSPNPLEFLYIHVWPNAYKNAETALGKQLYDMKEMALQYATDEEKGYIDSLDFKVNGEQADWAFDETHIDIVKLRLKNSLKPGESVKVSTPFKVKIPDGDISRLGHVGESYQITQWYPKPAVYDVDGWHQIPYLTQGEFYSEYGSFDVSITLPKNYVVGATGDLQTPSEIDFLNDYAARTARKFETNGFTAPDGEKRRSSSPFPKSDTTFKTIRYTQDNVHDFGWFADKRFEVLKGEVKLPHSERVVTSWAMFVPHHAELWKDAIEYINDGTYYYSLWNGDYAYNHVTAVDGTISAGGGMEYPNVTVIGNASSKEQLEVVIVHEVGHNWFYGMLGSNERVHPWMDEGLNTLNEMRYINTKYPNNTQTSDMLGKIAKTVHLEHLNHSDMNDLMYRVTAGAGVDQPIELTSANYTSGNYGGIVYGKTGLVFTYLKDYLGDELFDKCMRSYFDIWHFKHPQPNDFRKVMEDVSGKDLSWLFDDIIPTTKQIDYKISKVKQTEKGTEVTIKNVGQVNAPVRIDAYSFENLRKTIWIEPGDKKQTVLFPESKIDEVKIDGVKRMPEPNRNNNSWHEKGLFGNVEPINFEFLGGDNNPEKTTVWWSPNMGWNKYDKIMLGLAFHNFTLPKNKFEYLLAPYYSFGRKTIAGYAWGRYTMVPARNFKGIVVGLKVKNFGFEQTDGSSNYIALSPYVDFLIGKPDSKTYYTQKLRLQGAYNFEDGAGYYQTVSGGFAKYEFNYKKRLHQFRFGARADYISVASENISVANAYTNAFYKFKYWDKKKKHVSLQLNFAQNLLYEGTNSSRYGIALGGQTGTQDVFYETFMFGRNATTGVSGRRRQNNHGNFSTVSAITTNNQILSANLYCELPYVPLIGLFADAGIIPHANSTAQYAQMGIGIRLLDGDLGLFLPLVENTSLKNSYTSDKIWSKLRVTYNLTNITGDRLLKVAF